MSVLVKGMEMPESCWRCCLSQLYEKPRAMLVCEITHEEVLRNKIDGNCPLVPVPPHVRLIDINALKLAIANNKHDYLIGFLDELINNADKDGES